jgi:hypothetical protein
MIKLQKKPNYKKTKKQDKSKKNRNQKQTYIRRGGGGGLSHFFSRKLLSSIENKSQQKKEIIGKIFGLLDELKNIKLLKRSIVDLLLKKITYVELLNDFSSKIHTSINNPPEKRNNNKLTYHDLKILISRFLGLSKFNDILHILDRQFDKLGCDKNTLLSFDEKRITSLLNTFAMKDLDYLRALLQIFKNRTECFSKEINNIVKRIDQLQDITDESISEILTSSLNNNTKKNKFKYCFQKKKIGNSSLTLNNMQIPFFNGNSDEFEAKLAEEKLTKYIPRPRSVVISSRDRPLIKKTKNNKFQLTDLSEMSKETEL